MFGALLLEGQTTSFSVLPVIYFVFRKLRSELHERNVDEMFAQSRQQLGAREFYHGKQQVSPFYRISQLLHEKNVFRSPGNGTIILRLGA